MMAKKCVNPDVLALSRFDKIIDEIGWKVNSGDTIQTNIISTSYGFKWVKDERYSPPYTYEFDSALAYEAAKHDASKVVSFLKRSGYTVIRSTSNQIMKFGGIGSGFPEMEVYAKAITITAVKDDSCEW